MSDPMQELFTAALGISAPWKVAEVRFEPEAHAVHFDLACEATRLPCPTCAAPDQPIHDRQRRDWQHLHFFQYRAFLHADVPRVRCAVCGTPVTAKSTRFRCLGRASAVASRCCSRRWW